MASCILNVWKRLSACPKHSLIVWFASQPRKASPSNGFVRILVSEHLERRQSSLGRSVSPRKDVQFPLIPKEETGVITPITGLDLDEMFTRDYLAS
jgi:hypothetical protein